MRRKINNQSKEREERKPAGKRRRHRLVGWAASSRPSIGRETRTGGEEKKRKERQKNNKLRSKMKISVGKFWGLGDLYGYPLLDLEKGVWAKIIFNSWII